ncbi:MAG: hypothetical protein AAF628_02225 [Planctomycetota bacterium]
MRHCKLALEVGVATLVTTGALGAQIVNGDFEEGPPGMPGWLEVGAVRAGPPSNSAQLGPSTGVPLVAGSHSGSSIWQLFAHGHPTAECHIEFSYRVQGGSAWVEINGPAGAQGAFLPSTATFDRMHVEYPACGDLEISFNLLQPGPTVTALLQVDDVVATPIGDPVEGMLLPLNDPWLPGTPGSPVEQGILEMNQLRSSFADRFSMPDGFVTAEGDGQHGFMLFSKPWVTWQQVDRGLRGTPRPSIRSIAFRRDADEPDGTFPSRIIDVEVILAHSDVKRLVLDHSQNYVGSPTVVCATKTVQLPDWGTQPPPPGPAPWDVRFAFDVPWSYDGVDDLLWQVNVLDNPSAPFGSFVNYPLDFQSGVGSYAPSEGVGMETGTGCGTPGQMSGPFTLTGSLFNHLTKLRIELGVTGAPAGGPVFAHLGLSNPSIFLPLLCTGVFADPAIAVPLGVADSMGTINSITFDELPYVVGLVGDDVYMQGFGVDVAQPLLPMSLSNGLQLTVPADPTFPDLGRVYSFRDAAGGAISQSGPWSGGIVALFQ